MEVERGKLRKGDFQGTERFVVRRRLGQGGMGVVYEALDKSKGELVALKTLNRFDAQAIYRMKQEFRALVDVSHPNLVHLYELVFEDGQWFFTMELVDGVDLLDHVRTEEDEEDETLVLLDGEDETLVGQRERIIPPTIDPREQSWADVPAHQFSFQQSHPPQASLGIVRGIVAKGPGSPDAGPPPRGLSGAGIRRLKRALVQLVGGLTALHQEGKLHRDVKPGNVMVDKKGRVVLLDFGLVTEIYEQFLVRSTQEGAVCGTIAYMAPEQAVGVALSPAADLYGLGVVLFEALTGRLPFEGRLIDILLAKQEKDAPRARALVPTVPEDLDRLCAELLDRRPEARPTGEQVLRRLGKAPTDTQPISLGKASPAGPALFGREAELEALLRHAEAARERPLLVHLSGRSGMGKSALLRRFLDGIAQSNEYLVLAGRCWERELVPYKAFDSVVDALSRALRRLPKEEVLALVTPDVRALSRIFPVLNRVEAIAEIPSSALFVPDLVEVRRRAFAGLRALLAALASRWRLVVAIDDLQWGDEDSAALLVDLLRPPESSPILWIASYRSEDREGSAVLRGLAALAEAHGDALEQVEVRLGPLAPADAEALARSILIQGTGSESQPAVPVSTAFGDVAAQARTIAREADGNPLFVYELAAFAHAESGRHTPRGGVRASAEQSGELRLDQMLRARYLALPEAARRLLEVVAVAARPVPLALAVAAAELTAEIGAAVLQLRTGRFVRLRTGEREELEVYHNRIGDAVARELPKERFRAVHLALARALEGEKDADPEMLVQILLAAGEDERAGLYAVEAARRAAGALAFDRAASLYRQALRLASGPAPAELHVALGDALVLAGRGAEAAEAFMQAARSTPGRAAVELKRRAAQYLLQSGHVDRGLEVMRGVMEGVGIDYPETVDGTFRALQLQRASLLFRGLRYRLRREEEIPHDDLVRIDVCWSAATGLALVDPIRASYFISKMLRLALSAGEPYRLARALSAEVALVGTVDRRLDRTQRVLAALESLVERLADPRAEVLLTLARGFNDYMGGRWGPGAVHLERAIALYKEHVGSGGWQLDSARIMWFSSLSYMGELGTLPGKVVPALREAELRRNLYAATMIRTSPSVNLVWLAQDRPGQLERELGRAVRQWSQAHFNLQHFQALLSEIAVHLYRGEGMRAWSRIEERWEGLGRTLLFNMHLIRIEANFARGRAALAASRVGHEPGRMLGVASASARTIEGTGLPWARPLAALLRAQVAAAKGEQARADEVYGEAIAGADQAGMGVHRSAAAYRRGQIWGGAEGAALTAASLEWLRAKGVVNPEALIGMIAPLDGSIFD